MNLSDVFNYLVEGEVSHLFLASSGTQIDAATYAKLARHIRSALTSLHTRFDLRQEELVIQQYDNITDYVIKEKYGVLSGSAEPVKYILETTNNRFYDGKLIKVEEVYNEDGDALPLNIPGDDESLYTPSYNILQIPYPVATNVCSVIYRADHDPFTVDATTDPDTIEISLPEYLLLPLSYFVASRMVNPINQEQEGKATNYLAKYEAACLQIQQYGVLTSDMQLNTRLIDNGWI